MSPAISFIEKSVGENTPFLAVVWFVAPHTPVAAGPENRAAYDSLPMREQHWFGAISALDAQVGRLRNTLRKLRVEDDTLLWFCSDNGPSWVHELGSAGPLRGRKGDVYEGGIRVPSIVSWPRGIGGGRVVDRTVSTLDFLPTLVAATKSSPRLPLLDGEDVLPLLRGTADRRRGPVYFDYPSREGSDTWKAGETRQVAVIEGEWKLVSVNDGKRFELYDLDHDIGEATDVAAKQPALVKRLRESLDAWATSCAGSLKGGDYRK